ncbi:hypothetical protein QAD02_021809 [Eretmocerus hayati]|uniref:Uncharacterized protein n=1 Tax=Eretmocerus hayati TaxID=131215 RepID=A0ACC2PR85_9HYME|nr:hypothetical protein QAD02_021809 [Eretmocerus hayati]
MMILRLGGFHSCMSFLTAMGSSMDFSGLKPVFCKFLAELSASNALSGRAYFQGIRGHFLVNLGLSSIVLSMIDFSESEIEELEKLSEKVGEPDFMSDREAFCTLKTKFEEKLEGLKKRGPTPQWWAQLIYMGTLLQNNIGAERSGNFGLHIKTIFEMLPYFYAAGHIHYAKYAHIYLQTMLRLKEMMKDAPEEYKEIVELGFSTIRRTHKFWFGSWVDFVIEQMLMKNLKGRGGIIEH